jgi:hypothetical protein
MPKHFGAKMRNDFFKEVLQYCKIKIDNIDKPKQTEFQFTYEQEVTEERKNALQKRLAKLKTAEEKISFLRDEKAKYLQNISARTLEVSGSVHANFAPNAELFFDRYIQIEIDKLESLKKNYNNEVFNQTKNGKLQAPVIKLFCAIVHQSGVIIKGYDESPEKYITRVCKEFKIKANPAKARQYYDTDAQLKATDKNLKAVIELILPTLSNEIKSKIETYINSKIKLYG